MKMKILVLMLLIGGIFSFTFTTLEAQELEPVEFIINNSTTYDGDVLKELYIFFIDYIETYDINEIEYQSNSVDVLLGGLQVELHADLPNLDFTLLFHATPETFYEYEFYIKDYEGEFVFNSFYINENQIAINQIASYPFEVVISVPEQEPEPKPEPNSPFMTNQELIISLVLVLVISVLSLIILKEPIYMLGTMPIFINFLVNYDNNYIRVSTVVILVITILFLFNKGGNNNDFN